MKLKNKLLCAIMTLLLVSCSKTDDTRTQNPKLDLIDFSAYSGFVSSRALDKDKFVVKDQIYVSAFYHKGVLGKNDASGAPQSFVANFFDNLIVENEGTKWVYDNERHWPVNDDEYLSFVATYSKTPKVINVKNGEISIDNFIVNTDASLQEDLLWSGVPNRASKDGVVTFTFNHALSKIVFNTKTAEPYSNATIKIKSIVIKDIINKGNYIFGAVGESDLTWIKGFWSLPANAARTVITSNYSPLAIGKTQDVTAVETLIGESMLLIPQVVTNKAIYLNYSITDNKLTSEVAQEEIIIRPRKNWNQNSQYTYNITFKLDRINFASITIDEWATPISQEIPTVVTHI